MFFFLLSDVKKCPIRNDDDDDDAGEREGVGLLKICGQYKIPYRVCV